ncbi:MAG: NADH:flavin oxidoreductase/NADH oxidase [Ginsengibacter sp.]
MPGLFDPLKIRGVELKNRIVVSPMCQYSSVDGFANDWHLVHLGSYALGGSSLVFTEAAAISPEGRITPDDLGIWKDEHIEFLQRITIFIKSQNSIPGIQLAHAGRKASHSSPWKGHKYLGKEESGWQTVAPSAIPYRDDEPLPHEMTKEEIHQFVEDFKLATIRSIKAGFEVIEIHAAHGYLLNEFMSPISNQRNDEYGGSFENRIRILVEVVDELRIVMPESMPLFVRISVTDWVPGGWDENDSARLSSILKDKGVDLMDCSSGGNSPFQQIPVGPLYQVPFAKRIKEETGIMTGAVGLITKAEQANKIIESGEAVIVLLARQLLREPFFPLHAAKDLGVDVDWPNQYVRAKL